MRQRSHVAACVARSVSMTGLARKALALQRYVAAAARGKANAGSCPACGHRTLFVEVGPWLRDQYRCLRCQSVPRHRALLVALEEELPDWRTRTVLEPAFSGPASSRIAKEAASYTGTHFFPGVERGAVHRGFRVEDLHELTFADGSFDLVVTQDVFEHVLEPDRAFAEIARVLRPGGAHVFTVPVWPDLTESVVRARRGSDGAVEHVLPQMFHGDPVSNGALVVTDWAPADLLAYIEDVSGMSSRYWRVVDRSRGIDGEHLEVVLSRKP
ncbi:MAG: Methyltransferase type 11 [Frankiales bacterium]|nr:Methyltransferase type 11 [Frankiales bacterium]